MFKKFYIILLSFTIVLSKPFGFNLEELEDLNYDVVVLDQKQNGTQNFRIRVNGYEIKF